ncbi:MAG: hypothetical protein M5R38_11860 [Candidatus Methylomirabilis sp.]|nr:hypothetical protein [Candidatus Methylomirabilis sp.]
MADEEPIVGRTKHGELTLDQIAELQPGLGQLMPLMSERYWICYYAAKGGNWALAAYQAQRPAQPVQEGQYDATEVQDDA